MEIMFLQTQNKKINDKILIFWRQFYSWKWIYFQLCSFIILMTDNFKEENPFKPLLNTKFTLKYLFKDWRNWMHTSPSVTFCWRKGLVELSVTFFRLLNFNLFLLKFQKRTVVNRNLTVGCSDQWQAVT